MKKLFISLGMMLLILSAPAGKVAAQDPITLIIQQGITKVIVAVDLKIQRLQNKVIWLQNAQKVLENALSKQKLEEITGWVEKQRQLYEQYFDELWQVNAVLTSYSRLKVLIEQQQLLVKEYAQAWKALKGDRHFTTEEISYMGRVYSGILERSAENLQGVTLVIRSFSTQMSDGDRIALINRAADALQQHLSDLRSFTDQNIRLSLARAADEDDRRAVKRLYGLQ